MILMSQRRCPEVDKRMAHDGLADEHELVLAASPT
jgi:hypothetical protein